MPKIKKHIVARRTVVEYVVLDWNHKPRLNTRTRQYVLRATKGWLKDGPTVVRTRAATGPEVNYIRMSRQHAVVLEQVVRVS